MAVINSVNMSTVRQSHFPPRWPRISVITPSFNQVKYIEATIKSVIDQGYPNLEYIIIDGGSQDGSVEIIRSYENNLAYWVSEVDRGQSHAINKGLMRASGEIVAYLNSDDLYLPNTLHAVAQAYLEAPSVGIIHGHCRIVNEGGEPVGQRSGQIAKYRDIVDIWGVWWKKKNFVQPEVFWTRHAMQPAGPFREDLNWVMDFDFWLRLLKHGASVIKLDEELACFRMHPQQKSQHAKKVAEELLSVVQPALWENDGSLPYTDRLRLRARWLFDAVFRPAADELRPNESQFQRLSRLSFLVFRNPLLLMTPDLYHRAARVRFSGTP